MSASQKFFWGSPEKWPSDSADYVFLARTIDLFGKSLFGGEWTGKEITAERPASNFLLLVDNLYVNNLLATHVPSSGRKYFDPPPASRLLPVIDAASAVVDFNQRRPDFNISPDELHTAYLTAQRLKEENKPLIERLERVQREIARLAESEVIVTAYRSLDGGEQVVIPRVWWNTENLRRRFANCQIEPATPFNDQETGSAWIYVSRQTLDKVTGAVGEPPTEPESESVGARSGLSGTTHLRLTRAQKRERFQQWRASNPGSIPTSKEDIKHMKAFGVSRDEVRKLRKEFPRRSAGEKKKPTGEK